MLEDTDLTLTSVDLPLTETADCVAIPKAAHNPREWAERAASLYGTMLSHGKPPGHPFMERYRAQGLAFLSRYDPPDAIEQMLLSQMLWTHARMLLLTCNAGMKKSMEWFEAYEKAADRAGNTFRRQMLALQEYRQPKMRRRASFTSIRTAHISAQQVISAPPVKRAVALPSCEPEPVIVED